MLARSLSINGHFRALPIVDLPSSVELKNLVQEKAKANLSDSFLVCWPKVVLGDREHWLSSHAAGACAAVDAENGDIPFRSPSNSRLQITGAKNDQGEVWLDTQKAQMANANGVVTAINFIGGWKLWGNRLGCYPDETDVKETFVPIRRLFNWVGATLIRTFWSELDSPISRRALSTVIDSSNLFLASLKGRQALLDGRVEYLDSENPTTDVMDGRIRFHCYLTPPSPAEQIEFMLEYDPNAIKTLFA